MKKMRLVNGVGNTLDKALESFARNLSGCTRLGYLPIANPTIIELRGEIFITCFVVKEEA